MPCAYCGNDVDVVPRKFRSVVDDETVVVTVDVCKSCFKRYKTTLFDSCDQCSIVQEIRPNAFHVVSGKVLCVPCKDAWITKK